MGAELSKSGLDFVTYFSTATQITAEDVSRGVAALDTTFVSAIAVGAPTPVTTDAISASLEALFFNAVDNNRLGVGIDYARRQLDQTTAGQDGSGPADTAAAVRFAQCLITLAMARAEGGPFLLKKLIDSNGEATGLHNAAIAYVVANVKVTTTAQLRLTAEVLLLLQTLYSSALYHPALVGSIGGDSARDPHADTFLDAVATSTDPAMTKLYGIGLLHLVCEWAAGVGAATVSLTEYPPKDKPRLFNLYNMFGMAKRGSRLAISTIVGVRALHIFALLATYRKPGRPQPCMLTQFKAGKGPFGEAAGAPSASELLNVIAAKIDTCQELILILYLLCCHHPDAVKAAVTPNEDGVAAVDNIAVGQILTGIAKAEYNSVASSGIAPIAFLCGSVLLLLSRDTPSLPRWFSAATSAAAPWYAERYVGSISAGSLVVMVTARTVARAVAMSNHDVADMHLGFLANVAPFVHSLHTLAAQRLVSCLRHMLKRLAKAQSEVTRDSNNYEAIATLERLESHCATAMDVMLAILDGASRDNLSLLYDLLHQKSEIFGITSQWNPGTQIADAAAPLAKLISFHEAELSSFANNPNHTVEEVMQVIKKVADDVSAPDIVVGALPSSRQADASGIALCEANLFEYDEDENSYEFFAPLIWRAVLATSGTVLVLPGPRIAATIRLLRSDPAVEPREGGHAV